MKTLKDVLIKYTNQQIIKKLVEIYPDQKRSKRRYEKMIDQLRRIKPSQSDYLLITKYKYDVHGLRSGDKTTWALDFVKWSKWLGSKMDKGGLIPLCHCLWEMTYHGFTQQKIQGAKRSMLSSIKNIK